jgi:RNA polymerase sigma factor (sigma-70 family)
MPSGNPGVVLREFQRLFGRGTAAGMAEGQLLDRFVAERDGVAFEALLARHGPMVWGVCRRMLRDPREVEDAFQATFLVLVRKAGSIRDRELLGNWLYGVAYRVALRARANLARRRTEPADALDNVAEEVAGADDAELRSVLDDELGRLPEKYRAPIVLCYLEGQTHEEAALRLRWPVGTVRGRMARARELLRSRLARRGFVPGTAALIAALERDAQAKVPEALIASTVRTVLETAAGRAFAAGLVSASATALADGVLRTMGMMKLKIAAVGLLAAGVVAAGAVAAVQQERAGAGSGVAVQNPSPIDTGVMKGQAKAYPGFGASDNVAQKSAVRKGADRDMTKNVASVRPVDQMLDETRARVETAYVELTNEVQTLTARLVEARMALKRLEALKAALDSSPVDEGPGVDNLPPQEIPGATAVPTAPPGVAPVTDASNPPFANVTPFPVAVSALPPVGVEAVQPPDQNVVGTVAAVGAPPTALSVENVSLPTGPVVPGPGASSDQTKDGMPLIKVGDRLRIEVLEALPGRPLTGIRPVRTDGTISLDFYGDLKVAGLTRREAKIALIQRMRKFLIDEVLGLLELDENENPQKVDPVDSNRVFVDESPVEDSRRDSRVDTLDRQLRDVLTELRSLKQGRNAN